MEGAAFVRVVLVLLVASATATLGIPGLPDFLDSSVERSCDGLLSRYLDSKNITLIDIIAGIIAGGGPSAGIAEEHFEYVLSELPPAFVDHIKEEIANAQPLSNEERERIEREVLNGQSPDSDTPRSWLTDLLKWLAKEAIKKILEALKDPIMDVTFRCYQDYGCFTKLGWFSMCRLVNYFPEDPTSLDMKYLLFTRKAEGAVVFNSTDLATIESSTYNPRRETKIIVHSWQESPYTSESDWITQMVNELLVQADYNVIVVDWTKAASRKYTLAAANARIVARDVRKLFRTIRKAYGYVWIKAKNFHLIGYGLGAHLAGYVGNQGLGIFNLGRITGLDPVDPFFQWTNSFIRLDEKDAQFVDVIHTDSGGFIDRAGMGIYQPSGHVDFYPAGGRIQPGCPSSLMEAWIKYGWKTGWNKFTYCSHHRSFEVFIESVNSDCMMRAFECENFDQLQAGLCDVTNPTTSAIMGFKADEFDPGSRKNIQMYVDVGGEENPQSFCHHHIHLEFALDNQGVKESGKLHVILINELGRSVDYKLGDRRSDDFIPGSTYYFMFRTDREWGYVTQVEFYWESDHFSIIDPDTWIYVANLYIKHIKITAAESQTLATFCTGSSKYRDGKKYDLYAGGQC